MRNCLPRTWVSLRRDVLFHRYVSIANFFVMQQSLKVARLVVEEAALQWRVHGMKVAGSADALLELSRLSSLAGDYAAAESFAADGLQMHPTSPLDLAECYHSLAELHMLLNRDEQSPHKRTSFLLLSILDQCVVQIEPIGQIFLMVR